MPAYLPRRSAGEDIESIPHFNRKIKIEDYVKNYKLL